MIKWLDRLMGILWLSAVVLIPLSFNLYSRRVFEPEKSFVLRCAGILLFAVLVVQSILTRSENRRQYGPIPYWRQPRLLTLLPAIFLTLSMCIAASAFSISPGWSWNGSYEWRHGVFTFLACLALFFSLSWYPFVRNWQDILLVAIELTGAIVAGYGILQYLHLDPMPWNRVIEGRAFSTIGHPNFLAAYLVLVIPLAAVQLQTSSSLRGRFFHGFVCMTGLLGLFMTFSRSGWLGMLAAGGCFALLQVKWSPHPSRWFGAVIVLVVALVAVSLLAYVDPGGLFSYSPLEPLHSFLRGKSATAHVRMLTWRGAYQLITERPWFGFGPETFRLSFPRAYQPELAIYGGAVATGDHAHNELLDLALSAGVPGAAAYVWFLASVIAAGLMGLARISNKGQKMRLMGLLAGVAGYTVQNQLSFSTVAPMSLFWVVMGLIVAIAQRAVAPPSPFCGAGVCHEQQRHLSGRAGTWGSKAIFTGTALFVVLSAVIVMVPHGRALQADIHARAARDAAIAENWSQSITEYRNALTWSPGEDRYWKDLSNSYASLALSENTQREERFALAEAALEEAIGLSPLDVNYRIALGTLYYEWGVSGQKDKLELAAEAFREAAGMSPSDPQIWSRWGRVCHAQEQYALAVGKYEKALRLDPLHIQAYSYLGETYLAMQQIQKARAVYDKIDDVTEILDRMVSKR